MNRKIYIDSIEKRLNTLAVRIESRGKLNLLEINSHSENFFAYLCNIIFDLNLKNLNSSYQNIEGIDLIDHTKKVVAQVSSTCTKQKIESSLSKNIYTQYKDYSYKFISISKNASNKLRNSVFKNPHGITFNPHQDIWDIQLLLNKILNLPTDKLKEIYDFIENELGETVDCLKVESNLAKVINILAKEQLDIKAVSSEINSFAIEDKIFFNNLEGVKDIIDDYKIYYHILDKIYSEFDKEGQNKSFSVLQQIRRQYIELKNDPTIKNDPTMTFYKIISHVMKVINGSSNYIEIPIEELQVCADIIVVDTFIRCKIFENPEGYNHVITG